MASVQELILALDELVKENDTIMEELKQRSKNVQKTKKKQNVLQTLGSVATLVSYGTCVYIELYPQHLPASLLVSTFKLHFASVSFGVLCNSIPDLIDDYQRKGFKGVLDKHTKSREATLKSLNKVLEKVDKADKQVVTTGLATTKEILGLPDKPWSVGLDEPLLEGLCYFGLFASLRVWGRTSQSRKVIAFFFSLLLAAKASTILKEWTSQHAIVKHGDKLLEQVEREKQIYLSIQQDLKKASSKLLTK